MIAHTPAPWFPVWNGRYWDISIDDDPYAQSIAAVWSHSGWKVLGDPEANARLMAAAPKLLAACKTLIECATIADEMLTAVGKEHAEITIAIELARKFVADAEGKS